MLIFMYRFAVFILSYYLNIICRKSVFVHSFFCLWQQSIEYATSNKLKRINADEIHFDNNSNVAKAINMLSPQPKSRFIKYYIDGKTYKEIALEEGKHISSIYESVEGAKKKFLKYLNIFENTPEK